MNVTTFTKVKLKITYHCNICSNPEMSLLIVYEWLTCFGIPFFPTGYHEYYLGCHYCENVYAIGKEESNNIIKYYESKKR